MKRLISWAFLLANTILAVFIPYASSWSSGIASRTYRIFPALLVPMFCIFLFAVGLAVMIKISPVQRRSWPFHTAGLCVNLFLSWWLFRYMFVPPSANLFLSVIFFALLLWSLTRKKAV